MHDSLDEASMRWCGQYVRGDAMNCFPPTTTFGVDFLAKVGAGLVAICRLEELPTRDRSDYSFKDWVLHIDLIERHVIYRIGALRPDGIVYDAAWPD